MVKYRVFSLTWQAYMQIYCNKRKRLQGTGLGHQYGRRDVM